MVVLSPQTSETLAACKYHSHRKTQKILGDFDLRPMTLIFNPSLEVVKVHVQNFIKLGAAVHKLSC